AQGCGTAHRVPIRADMGEDQNIVKGPQQRRGLGDRQHAHSSVSPASGSSRASSCRSTWRRISRMWAPCWMESSAMNCSSGVYRSCRA
ncbi:Magnesium transporter MgtE intracellular domain-containing protein, partial [Dysosmobacter welbionis]